MTLKPAGNLPAIVSEQEEDLLPPAGKEVMVELDQQWIGGILKAEDQPNARRTSCEPFYEDLHREEHSANLGPVLVPGPGTSGKAGPGLPQEEGQLAPGLGRGVVRSGEKEDLVKFTREFDNLEDGSAVILSPVFWKARFPLAWSFLLHRIVKSFTETVQLKESHGFKYIFKKEKWADASRRSLDKEIMLGHSFEGVCKVLGLVKQVENGEAFICFLLEYCDGRTLEERRKESDWNLSSATCALLSLMKTVTELESRGVMITDLKPANFCFRSEDPNSICLVDLESLVDLNGRQRAYRYTASFSPPFHLDLDSSPDSKKKQMVEWHRWSVGVIFACCLPPFSKPWHKEMQECGGNHTLLQDLIIKHRKGIRKYLPYRRPPDDHWRPKVKYDQILQCTGGLLDLDLPLSIKECLDYAVFTDAAKVRLVVMTISGESLGGIQVEPGTFMDELIQLQQFKALVPKWRRGYQLQMLGRTLCPTTARFFKSEMLTVCLPPIVLTLVDGQTMTELGKIHVERGSGLKELLKTSELQDVMEGWNGGRGYWLKNSRKINVFDAHFDVSEELTVWPPL